MNSVLNGLDGGIDIYYRSPLYTVGGGHARTQQFHVTAVPIGLCNDATHLCGSHIKSNAGSLVLY